MPVTQWARLCSGRPLRGSIVRGSGTVGVFWGVRVQVARGDVRVWLSWRDVVGWLAGWLWRQAVPCVCEQLNARLAQEPTSWVGWGKYLDGVCWGHNTKETITRGAVPCALCTAGRLKHSTLCWVCPACVCLGLCGRIHTAVGISRGEGVESCHFPPTGVLPCGWPLLNP
jgi:hypothetical protein